ncbi:MAG: hypothetical protein JF592_18890 [Microbacterium sp.]|nr:hypothetical protein [Microbacterium sp.]
MNPNQGRAWLALVAIGELLPSALDAQLTADAGLTNFEYGTATPPHVALARDQLLAALGDDQLVTLAELLEPILERLHPGGAAECGRPAASATIAS